MEKLNFEKVLKFFLEIESTLNLFQINSRRIPLWEIIRYPLFKKILIDLKLEEETIAAAETKKDLFWLLNAIKFLFISLLMKNPFFIKRGSVMFFPHSRRKYENNSYIDIYTDPIISSINDKYNCVALEHPNINYFHKDKIKTKNIYYLDVFYCFFKIASVFSKKAKFFYDFSMLENKLKSHLDIGINISEFSYKYTSTWKIEVLLYKKLFQFTKPKMIFVADGAKNKSVIFAAKAIGITVAELQHGSPTKGKLNYDFPSGVSGLHTFPDIFLTFGNYWRESSKYPLPDTHVISIGFAYIAKKITESNCLKKQNKLLVISQPTISKPLISYVVKMKIKNPKLEILYKLHPKENIADKKEYGYMKSLGITVVDDQFDLYELFSMCKWQLGVYSTAIYEGLMFSCQAFILKATGYEFVQDLIDKKIAIPLSFDDNIVDFFGKHDDMNNQHFSLYSKKEFCHVIDEHSVC